MLLLLVAGGLTIGQIKKDKGWGHKHRNMGAQEKTSKQKKKTF